MENTISTLYLEGLSSRQISDFLKIDKKEVDLYIIDNYVTEKKNSKQKITKEILKEALSLKYKGETFENIAKKYNLSSSLFTQKFKKLRIDYNSRKYDYSLLNKETVTDIVKKFNDGYTVNDLIKIYGFNKTVLANVINENGGNTTPCSFCSTIFDNIDTEEKAYWLGFLYADGCVGSRDNSLELSLQLLDAKHLYKFKSFLNAENKIALDFKIGTFGRCRFSISNKHFKETLISLGCFPQKSLRLEFPKENQVPTEFLIPFIRGYFDGDGCLSHTFSDTIKSHFTVKTSFIGTKEFIFSLLKFLKTQEIFGSIYKNKTYKDNTLEVKFNKTNSVKLLNLIYNDASIYLDRKFEKYKFYAKHHNFAVSVSDYRDYERTISEKAKHWINKYFNIDFDTVHANTEITKKRNGFLAS